MRVSSNHLVTEAVVTLLSRPRGRSGSIPVGSNVYDGQADLVVG